MSNHPEDPTVYVEKTHPDAHKRKPPPDIQGWGADLDPAMRPAYPMERTPPRFINPPQQMEHQRPRRPVKVFHSTERPGLTPVYGTAQPPTGLSGLIRAGAFRQSENDLRHWLLLLLADRVNVVEGVLEDLAHGHVPNIFKEMGGPAEWRHNRDGFIRKAIVAGAWSARWCISGGGGAAGSARRGRRGTACEAATKHPGSCLAGFLRAMSDRVLQHRATWPVGWRDGPERRESAHAA